MKNVVYIADGDFTPEQITFNESVFVCDDLENFPSLKSCGECQLVWHGKNLVIENYTGKQLIDQDIKVCSLAREDEMNIMYLALEENSDARIGKFNLG